MDKNNLDFLTYTIQDIYSTKYYIIVSLKNGELKVVRGTFIRGHFDKCRVLSNPMESERLQNEELDCRREKYENRAKEIIEKLDLKILNKMEENQESKMISVMPSQSEVKVVNKSNKVPVQKNNIINSNVDTNIKITKKFYIVYSYSTALGLAIDRTNIELEIRPNIDYTTEYLINIFASIIIKSLKLKVKFTNLIIINFMVLN